MQFNQKYSYFLYKFLFNLATKYKNRIIKQKF